MITVRHSDPPIYHGKRADPHTGFLEPGYRANPINVSYLKLNAIFLKI